MNDEIFELKTKIERCRRVAAQMTDDELRHAFEHLADEYERRLPRRGAGFMLQPRAD